MLGFQLRHKISVFRGVLKKAAANALAIHFNTEPRMSSENEEMPTWEKQAYVRKAVERLLDSDNFCDHKIREENVSSAASKSLQTSHLLNLCLHRGNPSCTRIQVLYGYVPIFFMARKELREG